jgi:hypothetical protein
MDREQAIRVNLSSDVEEGPRPREGKAEALQQLEEERKAANIAASCVSHLSSSELVAYNHFVYQLAL